MDRKKLGEMMSLWGSDFSYGKGSGSVGAVASYYSSGNVYPEREYVEYAIDEVKKNIPLAEQGKHGWTKKDAGELRVILRGLERFLETDYSGKHGRSASYSKGDLEDFFDAYVEAALWSSNDESDDSGGEPLDKNYGLSDLSRDTEKEMVADCKKFLDKAWKDLVWAPKEIRGYPMIEMAGHDFWLTRNGHGAGFWDGDWPRELGQQLTKISKSFGETNLYVGDDGKIYS
ncbi:MAG TPA: hypothetical protein VFA98_13545 [Thermoanaerobaculia bacterium]|nr:hypothetical protein [Thermoanaerobaculia bacterium]